MTVNNIDKPEMFWFEDKDGNVIEWDIFTEPFFPPGFELGEINMCNRELIVTDDMSAHGKQPAWPVRALKWIISKLPNSWQGHSENVYSFRSTINSAYPLIKYFVEKSNFSLQHAAIVCADLCPRCLHMCELEISGIDLSSNADYLNKKHDTHCKYCKVIDPDYDSAYKLWVCYRTFKLGGDVGRAIKTGHISSDEDYMNRNGISYY